jgi:hypothetical protein
MYTVDLYLRVRLACHVEGISERDAASRFGIARETVRKMLRHAEPPGYRRREPPKRPKLALFTDWSCHGLVPVFQLIYAAFRSNAKGLLLFSDEWRRREL